MKQPLKVLVIDDAEDGAALALGEFERAGYELVSERVATRTSLAEALGREPWELALCKDSTPELDAVSAIAAIRERAASLPIIVIAGKIGEERAADCMRAGAEDVVLEHSLARLIPAAERAIHEVARRAEERSTAEELERAHQALTRTETLRFIAQMASAVSHDLKNLLNPLSLYLDLADRALFRGDIERARSSVGELKQVVQLGVDTVDRLRVFSRPTLELKLTELDLDAVVREAIALANYRLRSDSSPPTEIQTELDGPTAVFGEFSDLVSSVLHLVSNALEAMPNGGVVIIRTGKDGDRCFLEVCDTGAGMSTEIQEKLGEPFFSTKGEESTGLGLSVVRAAVLRHDGKLSFDSTPGRGTTVRVSLPASGGRSKGSKRKSQPAT